jgi:hypothetical protein
LLKNVDKRFQAELKPDNTQVTTLSLDAAMAYTLDPRFKMHIDMISVHLINTTSRIKCECEFIPTRARDSEEPAPKKAKSIFSEASSPYARLSSDYNSIENECTLDLYYLI